MCDQFVVWIDSKIDWLILIILIVKKWLNDGEGLQDWGIICDLDWGILVKKGDQLWLGMEGKVFYVWFDVLIEYIVGIVECIDVCGEFDVVWCCWWCLDEGVQDVIYIQFMGKDNVLFYMFSFLVIILGLVEFWKLVDYIKFFNYLIYDGGQFLIS